jgi:hypothetical protein
MVKIEDVKYWLTLSGIGHVVFGTKNGWTVLGCCITLGQIAEDECETEIPKRICKKCREKLKTATKAE